MTPFTEVSYVTRWLYVHLRAPIVPGLLLAIIMHVRSSCSVPWRCPTLSIWRVQLCLFPRSAASLGRQHAYKVETGVAPFTITMKSASHEQSMHTMASVVSLGGRPLTSRTVKEITRINTSIIRQDIIIEQTSTFGRLISGPGLEG